jgi:hypothetical protein
MRPKMIAVGIVLFAAIGCRPSDQSVARDEFRLDPTIEMQTLEQPSLTVVARVTEVSEGASWMHYEDGSFDASEAITFTIIQPKSLEGKELTINYIIPGLRQDSPLRKLKTICRFSINTEFVMPPPEGTLDIIYGDVLTDLTFLGRNNP